MKAPMNNRVVVNAGATTSLPTQRRTIRCIIQVTKTTVKNFAIGLLCPLTNRGLMGDPDTTILSLMEKTERGEASAADALFTALYAELHRLAKRELWRQGAIVSFSATTLLHEAYLDIAARSGASFPDQARFMGYAARVMRGLIIDHARSRSAVKRGGHFEITRLGTEAEGQVADEGELTRISEAVDQLARTDSALAEIVDLKFFCGFSYAEIAAMRNVSERTVQRQWEKARIYLHRSLSAPPSL